MRVISKLSVTIIGIGLAAMGCTERAPTDASSEVVAEGETICEFLPDFCKEKCAKCEDIAACYKQGGVCKPAAATSFNDTKDVNADVFTPSCHHQYTDGACTSESRSLSTPVRSLRFIRT